MKTFIQKVNAQIRKDKAAFKKYFQTLTVQELKDSNKTDLFLRFFANKQAIQAVLIDELIQEVAELKKQGLNTENTSDYDILDVRMPDDFTEKLRDVRSIIDDIQK